MRNHALTHWRLDKMASNFLMTIPNAFSWMKIYKLRLILHWSLFPMVQLKHSSTGSDKGLAPARRHAIIWTNDGYITDASLGLNELTHLHVNSPPANTPIKDSVTKAALLIGTIVKTKLLRLLWLPVPGNNGCNPTAVWTIRASLLKYRRIHHDDVIKWKHFPRYWSFVRGIHRFRWIPCTKASDAELWCFLWSAREQTVE